MKSHFVFQLCSILPIDLVATGKVGYQSNTMGNTSDPPFNGERTTDREIEKKPFLIHLQFLPPLSVCRSGSRSCGNSNRTNPGMEIRTALLFHDGLATARRRTVAMLFEYFSIYILWGASVEAARQK